MVFVKDFKKDFYEVIQNQVGLVEGLRFITGTKILAFTSLSFRFSSDSSGRRVRPNLAQALVGQGQARMNDTDTDTI